MREVLRREWLVASRSLGQLGQTLLFMLLVLTLFPLAISPERPVSYTHLTLPTNSLV